MEFIDITEEQKDEYNAVVTHPLQTFEWGEFRTKTGIKVIRRGLIHNKKLVAGFSLTIHKIPYFPYNIGYLPKGDFPTEEVLAELKRIGKKEKCVYIQLEPNLPQEDLSTLNFQLLTFLTPSIRPLFTKYTFVLDLTKSEEELLTDMHSKTRYNIRLAEKKGVEVEEDNTRNSFDNYLHLMFETTRRQKFYAHTPAYHTLLWETLANTESLPKHHLTYHLLHAYYKPEGESERKLLSSWVLFAFGDTLYYPYGASSREYREVMASNLLAWEAIKLGKNLGMKKFDMWGALPPNTDTSDPWYGFHRFKEGYGATLTEFVGSYDLLINPHMYNVLKVADKARWALLKLRRI